MLCPKCGAENEERAKFCLECAHPFARKDGTPEDSPKRTLSLAVIASATVTVVALVAAVLVLLSAGGDSSSGTSATADVDVPPAARTSGAGFTSISLLVGGPDKSKIDTRTFDIIAAGMPWQDLNDRIFPGDELDVVMIFQEDRGLSTGITANAVDPARVDALWKEMGQPNRRRPLYFAQIGDARNAQVERWLKEKLSALGFELTADRKKARESVMFTVAR